MDEASGSPLGPNPHASWRAGPPESSRHARTEVADVVCERSATAARPSYIATSPVSYIRPKMLSQ